MNKRSFFHSVLLTLLCLLLASNGLAQDRGYFPETGPRAVHQRALDVNSGAAVLVVALQPGFEDLNLLARLRLGLGARTFVLYWTNGEATPDDADGASPGILAAARREEAFHVTRLLGAQASYLNLPDPGVVFQQKELAAFWNSDSVLQKAVPLIRSFGPDVIVVAGDFRGDSVRSARQRALTRLVLAGVKQAAQAENDTLHAGPWQVQRVFVQTESAVSKKDRTYDQLLPPWKKSYRAVAQEAGREYRTLRYQLPSWLSRGDPQYAQVYPAAAPAPKQLIAGVPTLTARLKGIGAVVRGAAGKALRGAGNDALVAVSHAVDSLNLFIARNGATLSPAEFRVISHWKNSLEDLKCPLLGVSVKWESSDSLVTQGQLFYLKFKGLSSQTSKTHTTILFPGVMQRRWGVNESAKYQYEFLPPQEYRVITPTPMDYNYPGAQFGILRPFPRTRFTFLINHQDSLPNRDFVYRGELLLQAGPRRTFELLTPAVRALDGEPVAYRLQNITRDAFEGSMSLSDSILNAVTKRVYLAHKDDALVDTLFLSFKQPPPVGTSTVTISLSGMGGSIPVVVRRFDAAVDSSARLLLFSGMKESPLALAMQRLRLPFQRAGRIQATDLRAANVVVIDRDAMAGSGDASAQVDSLKAWVQQGGHLVVFPQGSVANRGGSLVPWASFDSGPVSAPDDSVVASMGNEILEGPNPLSQADWSNWVVSRALWHLRVSPDHLNGVVVRTAHGNIPLLLTRKEGRGRVTIVALDLQSQLSNLHPGAYRLLGNLLKRAGE